VGLAYSVMTALGGCVVGVFVAAFGSAVSALPGSAAAVQVVLGEVLAALLVADIRDDFEYGLLRKEVVVA
jgi:hypothetical protein